MSNPYRPNTASIPNVLFDYWMNKLSPGEFKVLMAIARKTYGWNKEKDRISLRQLVELTALHKSGVIKATERLVSLGLVIKIKSHDVYGDLPNQYEINIYCEVGGVENNEGGSLPSRQGGVDCVDRGQSTESTHKTHSSKPTSTKEEEEAPPDGGLPPPLLSDPPKKKAQPTKPFKSANLEERVASHPRAQEFRDYFFKPLIGIDQGDHDALVAKHGKELVDKAYHELAEWKLSKADLGKTKELNDHTDLHRLKGWVIKKVSEVSTSSKNPMETFNAHAAFAIALKKKYDPHPKITFGREYVEFDNGMMCAHLKLTEKDFIQKCKIELTKKGLDTNI